MKKTIIVKISLVMILVFYGIGYAGINDGLVAYYPFNGNANDESGNGNHGTIHGANLTYDRFGQASSAYYFDGNDDYISVPDSNSLDVTKISMSAWIF